MDEADDAVVNTQTQQHLAYAATLVETLTKLRLWSKELFAHTCSWPCHSNNLDTRIDFKTTNLAGSLTVIRDGSAEFKGAEKACIYFGGQITPQDGFQIMPSDSASQVGARCSSRKKVRALSYLPCSFLVCIDTYLENQEKSFVREKSDRSSVTI